MLEAQLVRRAEQMGIAVSGTQAAQFAQYHRMLTEANARQNLTRVPDTLEEAIDRNYLDSLAPLAAGWPDQAERWIDVGSGAGFPGIPLAILLPETRFVLMDSMGKRVRFLQEVIDALELNGTAVQLRAEEGGQMPVYREQFDVATARAVAPLSVLAELLLPMVRPGGVLMALKGPAAEEELREAEAALRVLGGGAATLHQFPFPDRDWVHTVIRVEKVSPTPAKYPRRPGIPEKRPLK